MIGPKSLGASCVAILCLAAVGACSSSTPTTPPATTSATIAGDTAADPTATTSAESASAPSSSGSFSMPNEVGRVLQDAQDDIQRVSGNPIFFTHSTDATGAGRHQILDRDWQVCSQNVAPGRQVDENTDITFAVVKLSETCP